MQSGIDLKQQLQLHPFVKGFGLEHVEKLASMGRQVAFEPDHIIFREGEESKDFFLIFQGRVALEIASPGHTLCLQTLGEGDELGWSSLLRPMRKQFRARALERVHALAFDGDELLQACEQQCAFGYVMLRSTLSVVADRLHNTLLQLLDVYRPGRKVS